MALVSTAGSHTVYEAAKPSTAEKVHPNFSERVQSAIDSFVEYPGSVKGDFGIWRFPDWAEAKVIQMLSHGGRERR